MAFGVTEGVELSTTTVAVLAAVLVVLMVGDFVLSARDQRVWASCASMPPLEAEATRIAFFQRWAVLPWLWVVALVVLLVGLPGVGIGAVGLRLPQIDPLGDAIGLRPPFDATVTVLLLVGVAVVLSWAVSGIKRWTPPDPRAGPRTDGALPPWGLDDVDGTTHRAQLEAHQAVVAQMPTGRPGRRWFLIMTVTAAVCEELLYRGLTMLVLTEAFPDLEIGILVLITGALAALSKSYSGTGALQYGVIGLCAAGVYVWSDSLLPGMFLLFLMHLAMMKRYAPAPG